MRFSALGFFYESVYPKPLSIPFWENSRGFCHTSGKWKNLLSEKFFYYFFRTPLCSRINIQINFSLQVHFKMSAVWYCSPLFATSINNTSGTGGKICRQCRSYGWLIGHQCSWHWCCTFICEYLREFSKKFKMHLLLFSEGLWERQFMKKSWSKKSRATVPLNFKHYVNCT